MNRLQTFIAGTVLAALAVAALGIFATAAATNTRLVIVNGWAGKTVNICLDGKRVAQGVRYGKYVVRFVNNKKHVIKFVRAPLGCGATKLVKRSFDPPSGGTDATIVLTRRSPGRLMAFSNDDLNAALGEATVAFALRHAGDLGKVTFKGAQIGDIEYVSPAEPSASPDPVWVKGDRNEGVGSSSDVLKIRATRPDKSKVLAKTPWTRFRKGYRTEIIVVGDKGRNAKLVRVKVKNRPGPTPSPTPAP